MYRVAWNLRHNHWEASRDGGQTWHCLRACNIMDQAEAIEEAARRTGVPEQQWIGM
jgi:hypothetical protein